MIAAGTRTIAIVEDEAPIADAVAVRLRSEGYEVHTANDGREGVELVERIEPDLVVLDLMLPGLDGLEVCKAVQAKRAVPVLMLTARDTETDMIVGLEVGADDYMTKPFSPRELVARVKAILRRSELATAVAPDAAVVRVRDVELDPATRRVSSGGAEVHLTPLEFDLVRYLAERPDRVSTRDEILASVWGYSVPSGARTVDSHIRSIRRKLGADIIRTVHGVGYAVADGTESARTTPSPAVTEDGA